MKKSERDLDPAEILGKAYEQMYEDIASSIHRLKEKSAPVLHELIEESREKVLELSDITKEDADKLAEYLKRDLHDFAENLSETDKEVKDWLGFETSLVEAEFLKWMQDVADPTILELLKLKDKAQHAVYHTGEITGPGTLVCDQCGEKLHFHKAGKIPPCPKCHATNFHRAG